MKRRNLLHCLLTIAATGILAGASLTALAGGARWESHTTRDKNDNICIDFQEVQVLLPSDWSGKCQMSTEHDSVSFYQTKSRELWTEELGYPNGGWLFSINFTTTDDYLNNPNYVFLGNGSDGMYYADFPTDLQAYTNDESAYNEFQKMYSDIDWIKANISMRNTVSTSDYIFPQSSSAYLSESDLSGMKDDQIQMAINEIYARHHRKFVTQSVQDYFNAKSWYTGAIEAADFDASVMNAYEGANIGLMASQLNHRAASDQNGVVLPSATKDAYGMIIESENGYFKIRQEDGSVTQFWYDNAKLKEMSVTSDSIKAGAIASLLYDTESYEAVSIVVW